MSKMGQKALEEQEERQAQGEFDEPHTLEPDDDPGRSIDLPDIVAEPQARTFAIKVVGAPQRDLELIVADSGYLTIKPKYQPTFDLTNVTTEDLELLAGLLVEASASARDWYNDAGIDPHAARMEAQRKLARSSLGHEPTGEPGDIPL